MIASSELFGGGIGGDISSEGFECWCIRFKSLVIGRITMAHLSFEHTRLATPIIQDCHIFREIDVVTDRLQYWPVAVTRAFLHFARLPL